MSWYASTMFGIRSARMWSKEKPDARAGVGELLGDFSLEVTCSDIQALGEITQMVPPGTQVSMTFLPNEELTKRLAIAAAIRGNGFEPMPHLSARSFESADLLSDYLDRLRDTTGISRVFVIAGDVQNVTGPYADALALIESGYLAARGIECIAIAGYPEGHPTISDDRLWAAMYDKRAAISAQGMQSEIITQFGFNADLILEWLRRLRDEGIDDLVRIGVPGPANARTLMRYAAICGVTTSTKVLAKYGLSLTRLLVPSGPDRMIRDLVEGLSPSVHGRTAIHFFPFGGLGATATWIQKTMAD